MRGRWSIDNSWVVDLLFADLLLADLLADVLLADLLADVLLGAQRAALGARRSDTMHFIKPSLLDMLVSVTMATVISITVLTSITGLFGFMPCSVVLLEKVVHNQGIKK